MPKRNIKVLWIITAFVVVILIATTINMVLKERANREVGFIGYISGVNSAVFVREEPSANSTILTIVELDTPVLVTDRHDEGNQTWYRIQADNVEGWLPAERVSTESPELQ